MLNSFANLWTGMCILYLLAVPVVGVCMCVRACVRVCVCVHACAYARANSMPDKLSACEDRSKQVAQKLAGRPWRCQTGGRLRSEKENIFHSQRDISFSKECVLLTGQ